MTVLRRMIQATVLRALIMAHALSVSTAVIAHYTCPEDLANDPSGPEAATRPQSELSEVPVVFEDQLMRPDPNRADTQFGEGLALDGDTLAASAADASEMRRAINIYRFADGNWQPSAVIHSPTRNYDDFFYFPALDDDTLFVGAWGFCHSGQPGVDCRQGKVYVFERSSRKEDDWQLTAELDGGFKTGQRFGEYVALDQDTAVISATAETIAGTIYAGAAYIFERDPEQVGQWRFVKRIESDSAKKTEGDFFGAFMLLHEDTLFVVGDDGAMLYEYGRNVGGPGNWGLEQKLPIPNGQAFYNTFDGETLVLNILDPCPPVEEWTVRLAFYEKDGSGVWTQYQEIERDYDNYRVREMALEGNTLVAHAFRRDHVAHVYERDGRSGFWSLKSVLLSSDEMESRYGNVKLDLGRALVSYPFADVGGLRSVGSVYYYKLADSLNSGHAGAWYFPETSGQGQFLDVEPDKQFVFLGWFTYADDDSGQQHWYTAEGHYEGNQADLVLYESLGGRFDDPQAVTTRAVGTVTLNFSDCNQGHMAYRFDDGDRHGSFPMVRVIPGSGSVCEKENGSSTQAVNVNHGMDGGWYDPGTSGQGFFFDVHDGEGDDDFLFVSWFTYGEETASGQRWLTAEGDFDGSRANLVIYETTGGRFDDSEPAQSVAIGTMQIEFSDCNNAVLSYSLPEEGRQGSVNIRRVVPGSDALCEVLSGR